MYENGAQFASVAIISTGQSNALYKKYPQANKLTFENTPEDVRDSILSLQDLMEKLPKRWDNEGVSYEIEKYRDEGLPRLDRRGMKGDLILHYKIVTPSKLSSEEKKLYSALLEIE